MNPYQFPKIPVLAIPAILLAVLPPSALEHYGGDEVPSVVDADDHQQQERRADDEQRWRGSARQQQRGDEERRVGGQR